MRIHQLRSKKRITFEEWKARKDREAKRDKEMKFVASLVESSFDRQPDMTRRLIPSLNDFAKRTNELHDLLIKEQLGSKTVVLPKKEVPNSDDYIIKEPGKLTFREWLHNKNIMEREKLRKKREEQLEIERRKKEREDVVNKAYNAWLIRNKYRTLQKYYPHLGEDRIKEILLEDISRLNSLPTKDVGVGDSTVDLLINSFNI